MRAGKKWIPSRPISDTLTAGQARMLRSVDRAGQ